MIHSKIIGIGVITGLCSMAALAEPAVQPGDTLESLSKVKVTTTVNGQPGSISDLVNSGQVQQVSAAPTSAAPTGAPIPADVPPHLQRAVKWLLQLHQLMLCRLHRIKRLQRHKIRTLHRQLLTRTNQQTQWQKMGRYQQMHLCHKLNNPSHKKTKTYVLVFLLHQFLYFDLTT